VIACIQIPYFAIVVEHNSSQKLKKQPLVIASYSGRQGKVYAACHLATEMGVQPGMRLNKARALCPDAKIIPAVPSKYNDTLQVIVQLLLDYGNHIDADSLSDGQVATIYLDLGKLTAAETLDLAQQMMLRIRAEIRLNVRIGLATNKFATYVQASSIDSGWAALIPRGHEADFLARFPAQMLPLDKEMSRRLDLLGIATIGQFAALPGAAVLAQFSRQGRTVQRLAQGYDNRRITVYELPKNERMTHHFDIPISDRLILEAVIGQMSEESSGRLQSINHATGEITLTVHLEDCIVHEKQIALSQPTSNLRKITRILFELLDMMIVKSGVVTVTVRLANLTAIVPIQLDLFGHKTNTQDWKESVYSLIARYGEDYFYQPVLNSHTSNLPERSFHLERIDTI
jgi:DNA polymerase IV